MGRRYPDGPKINLLLALVGQLLPRIFPYDPLAFGLSVARQFGDVAYYHVGPIHVYQLNHPDLARQILVEQPEKFHKARFIKRAFRPFAGNGLLTSDGMLWKQQRKLIQPAFHHGHVAAYGNVMVAHARRLIDGVQDGQVREISADMMKLTLGIVVKTLFGADFTREADEVGDLTTRRNLRERRALGRLDAMLQDVIRTRRASGEHTGDLLSMLLMAVDEDSGARMSDRQLRDEMMTLFLAGHETTANALTWAWNVPTASRSRWS
jgi:cytochrome P450